MAILFRGFKVLERLVLVSVAFATASVGQAAFAAEETAILDVTATVHDTCDVSLTPLAFGDMETAVPASGTAQIDVYCTSLTADPTITLGEGAHYESGYRAMGYTGSVSDPTHSAFLSSNIYNISYKLGFDAEGNIDGQTASQPLLLEDQGDGFWKNSTTIYGTTVPTPRAVVGSYADSVVVTVAYMSIYDN